MPSKPTIVFDCDDVLVNLRQPLAQAMQAGAGYTVPWTQWEDYDLPARAGVSAHRFVDILLAERVLEAAQLEPSALPLFARLRAAGFALEVWTARAWHPDAQAITAQQLAPLVAPDAIRLFDMGQCKAEAAMAAGVAALVEDNAGPIQVLTDAGAAIHGVVLERPWNAHYPELPRCRDLAAVGDWLLSR